jgi:hypothetical protein
MENCAQALHPCTTDCIRQAVPIPSTPHRALPRCAAWLPQAGAGRRAACGARGPPPPLPPAAAADTAAGRAAAAHAAPGGIRPQHRLAPAWPAARPPARRHRHLPARARRALLARTFRRDTQDGDRPPLCLLPSPVIGPKPQHSSTPGLAAVACAPIRACTAPPAHPNCTARVSRGALGPERYLLPRPRTTPPARSRHVAAPAFQHCSCSCIDAASRTPPRCAARLTRPPVRADKTRPRGPIARRVPLGSRLPGGPARPCRLGRLSR